MLLQGATLSTGLWIAFIYDLLVEATRDGGVVMTSLLADDTAFWAAGKTI